MRMSASGKPLGKIASKLALSPRTVITYRSRVLEKMHMKTNADLTRYALQNADSVAALILTTDAMVAELPKDEKVGGMPGGGMGGMDMM